MDNNNHNTETQTNKHLSLKGQCQVFVGKIIA